MIIHYDVWPPIGEKLKTDLYKKRYVTPEQYVADNPLENLIVLPDVEHFFGTKICNIFIVGVPYGWSKVGGTWTEDWPPEGFDEAVDRHKAAFEKFNHYETHIYMDFIIVAQIMTANPTSRFREMMEATRVRLTAMCEDLSDYGFHMEGDITTENGPEFFKPIIDKFFGINT